MEEDDGFGGGIVDFDMFGCLIHGGVTCLMSILSLRTSVSRWNFCCCVTLLYLHVFLAMLMLKYNKPNIQLFLLRSRLTTSSNL
jgi:hypothetical protein